MLFAGRYLTQPISLETTLVFVILVAIGMALYIHFKSQTLIERLLSVDRQQVNVNTPPPQASPPNAQAVDDAAIEQARQQVQGPAIGLLTTGILSWLALPVIVWLMLASLGPLLVVVPISLLIVSIVVMILAALKMKRLEAFGLAIVASILAIIVSPSNLIGLPIGIWALVVLSEREVPAAFRQKSRIGCVKRTNEPESIR